MKGIITLILALITSSTMAQSENIYDYSFTDIQGNEVSLKQFEGKKILIVNVASKCGYTPQYEDLQKLHESHSDKLVIIGFPCDQFGGQEPGDESEIQAFCQKNYGVEFLMASKIEVKGDGQHPIYKWLTDKALNKTEDTKVQWNFQKYLIDEHGKYIEHFKTNVNPLDEEITKRLN